MKTYDGGGGDTVKNDVVMLFETGLEKDIYDAHQTIDRLETQRTDLIAQADSLHRQVRQLANLIDLLQYRWVQYTYHIDLYRNTEVANTEAFRQWQRQYNKRIFDKPVLHLMGFTGDKVMAVNDEPFGSYGQCENIPIDLIIAMYREHRGETV